MNAFFTAHDPLYAWIALGLFGVDRLVLFRVLPRQLYAAIHMPALILHELTHWIVAALLGGRPTTQFYSAPHKLPGGGEVSALTQWGDLWIGDIGRWMACAAPMGWFLVALVISDMQFGQSQGFFEGVGWLLAMLLALGAGFNTSAHDLRCTGLITTLFFVQYLLFLVVMALLIVNNTACRAIGFSCTWMLSGGGS